MDSKVTVTVDIGYKHIAKFLFHGGYYKGQGVAEVGFSLMCLVYYFVGFRSGIDWLDIILLLLGLTFTVFYPLFLLGKAALMMWGQRKSKSSTTYEIGDKGIHMSQERREEANVNIAWSDVFFMHETKGMILLYMTPKIALILPKEQLNNSEETINNIIKRNMDPKRCKFLKK
ncbi:MAG: YcxB family protein [Lachnospiraceae bacterium]|nr:YcxB family protein [Lachnospiraceae bacterium]